MTKEIFLKSSKFSSRTFRIFHKDHLDSFLKTEDGTRIRYQLIKYDTLLIIWSAGAWGNIIDSERWCNPLREEYNHSTFSYDLRGMGKSKGSKYDFVSQILDLHDIINFAISEFEKRYEISPKRVIIIGHSLGAVAGLTVGIQHPRVDLVFALSSLYSLEDLFPKEWLIKFIKSISKNKNLNIVPKYYLTNKLIKKAYIIHGKEDKFIPYKKGSYKIIKEYNLPEDQFLLLDDGHLFTEKNLKKILKWIDIKIKANLKK